MLRNKEKHPRHDKADDQGESDLLCHQDGNGKIRSQENAQKDHGHGVGRRVIGAAFQFQKGRRAVLQVQIFALQNGGDGGVVRGAHDGAEEHGFDQGKFQHVVDEEARHRRRNDDAERTQDDGGL